MTNQSLKSNASLSFSLWSVTKNTLNCLIIRVLKGNINFFNVTATPVKNLRSVSFFQWNYECKKCTMVKSVG